MLLLRWEILIALEKQTYDKMFQRSLGGEIK